MKFFREAARLEPSAPGPAFQLGKIYFQNHDDRTAIPWLLKIKKENPHYLEASFLLGLIYYRLQDWEKAENAFRAVTEKLPLNEAFNNLGVVQVATGQEGSGGDFSESDRGRSERR